MSTTTSAPGVDYGQQLSRRVALLVATALAIFAAMLCVFVDDVGGWQYVHKVGLLEALTQYLMRPLRAIVDPSRRAAAQSWGHAGAMLGLLLALSTVGGMLRRALYWRHQYRLHMAHREWDRE